MNGDINFKEIFCKLAYFDTCMDLIVHGLMWRSGKASWEWWIDLRSFQPDPTCDYLIYYYLRSMLCKYRRITNTPLRFGHLDSVEQDNNCLKVYLGHVKELPKATPCYKDWLYYSIDVFIVDSGETVRVLYRVFWHAALWIGLSHPTTRQIKEIAAVFRPTYFLFWCKCC